MGLKCRLLGHSYGDTDVQRNREEQGDEVVVTIREVQVCERCGAEQVVSQNKEVTAIRTPEEVGLGGTDPDAAAVAPSTDQEGGDPTEESQSASEAAGPAGEPAETADEPTEPADTSPTAEGEPAVETEADAADPAATDADPASASPASAPDETAEAAGPIDEAEPEEAASTDDGWETGSDDWEDVDADPDADDGIILDGTASERDEAQWPEDAGTDPVNAAQESQAIENGESAPASEEEVTNDAEIIDGTDEEPEREHGAWPERDESDSGGWPSHDAEDEGFDASTAADADVDFSGNGLTPEVNGRADLDGESNTVQGVAVEDGAATASRSSSVADDEGFARAGESTTLESDVPDERVEFYCPSCGHARTAGASSMRAGDICPECKRGYIAERER